MDTTRAPARVQTPQPRRWTRLEYERAAELGLFGPEERLELIEGEIVQKVTKRPPHAVCTDLVDAYLRAAFPTACVRGQNPLAIDDVNEPEPDFAVVPGSARDYLAGHPVTAMLVVEVADTSLTYDRTTKAGLYARAGVAEYWILNLCDRLLEVHREPGPMTEQPLGFSYRLITRYCETDTVVPLAAPLAPMRVADLLP